jgi:hypothetical protein
MPYVTPDQIERVKQMNLLTYLQYYEPQELVRFSGNVYITHTNDSLKITNGKWCWWSHNIGGRKDWRQQNSLSLAAIYKPKQNIEESTSPAALMQFLKDHPYIYDIVLHLDNDTAGQLATKAIQTILPPNYVVFDEPPKRGKDYNDYFKITLKTQQIQARE